MPTRGTHHPHGLRAVLVRDAMTTPIVTCTPDVPIEEVADLMARNRIHSVVVLQPDNDDSAPAHRRWGVLSDLDLVSAAPWGEGDATAGAGTIAASPQVVVRTDDSLAAAALLMAEYATAHVLVIEEGVDEPVGILSALDVARALAGERQPAPPRARRTDAVSPGDRLVVTPHRQGQPPRDAEVLEVRGADGGPPFLVRWEDTGRVSLHYPGSDAVVKHISGSRS